MTRDRGARIISTAHENTVDDRCTGKDELPKNCSFVRGAGSGSLQNMQWTVTDMWSAIVG